RLWSLLAEICGRSAPTRRIPHELALTLGWADDLRCRLVSAWTHEAVDPLIPLEGVRMARHYMYVNCDKARSELGYEVTSAREALERAVRWYHDNGYSTS
ncbi:MAG TPA: NAD-dependent dehydratase, partial [Chloroflexota bacterium]|nr:NAD-dependent dehydratase [Chloroflexota bacterium]